MGDETSAQADQSSVKRRAVFTIRFEYDVWSCAAQLTDDVILEMLYEAAPGVIPDPADERDEGAVFIEATYIKDEGDDA